MGMITRMAVLVALLLVPTAIAGCSVSTSTSSTARVASASPPSQQPGAATRTFCDDLRVLNASNKADPKTLAAAKATFEPLLPLLARLANEAPAEVKANAQAVAGASTEVIQVLAKYGWDIDKALTQATGADKAALNKAGALDDPDQAALTAYGAAHCAIPAPPQRFSSVGSAIQ